MAALMEELVEDILLRFPPDDPASLVRATLVCKQWCRLISSQGFHRRFREFHRTPPVLGILCNSSDNDVDKVRLVPTHSFPHTDRVYINWRAADARHGRVLLVKMPTEHRAELWYRPNLMDLVFAVWDPVTDEARELPRLPRCPNYCWNAAVLCAATTCDHQDCSRGPFLVVVLDAKGGKHYIHVYSSESGKWSQQTVHVQDPGEYISRYWMRPSVLVGDELCSMFLQRDSILKYNVRTRQISVMDLPSLWYKPDLLISTDDGRLGFAAVRNSKFYLRSMEDGPGGNAVWTEMRVVVELKLPVDALVTSPTAIGFAADVGLVFVATDVGVFSFDLRSHRVRKILTRSQYSNGNKIVPYMSFYTPAFELRGPLRVKD
ncbi:hypothetical protein EJB05_14108, partial [Eragrostis curvula]